MNDKEIGEIWQSEIEFHSGRDWVLNLIRKLVEERALRLCMLNKSGALWSDEEMNGALRLTLRDFGIPLKQWKS